MPDDSATPLETTLSGVRILVVDDSPESLSLLSALLRLCGATVRTAVSVSNALDTLQLWRPDVVLADLNMPEENGYQLLRQLREREDADRRLPAIAITGDLLEEHRSRAAAAGFETLLLKPIGLNTLVAAIVRATSRAPGASSADDDDH
jgi:two-component system, OmpR family, response regulator